MSPAAGSRKPATTRPAPARRKPADAGAGDAPLADVLEAVPFACAAFARDTGTLVAANTRFAKDLGALPGHAHRDALLASLYGDATGDARGEEVRAPDSGRWYALHWRELDSGGRALSLLTAVDISERIEALDSHKSQQEKLLFTSRLMSVGEMAATLAHELNQPLAAIVNYLNGSLRLVDQAGGPVQVERALLAARTQAEHASAVIGRVREFVRAREPRRDAQDLPVIVDTVLELLRLEAERQQLRVELALAPQLPQVYADRVMIEQVLLNLVKNAIEAMREVAAAQRGLRIEARVNLDGEIEVRVCDRGPGLSQAQSEQLFSPFYTTKTDGLGIGLAICRSIIEYHEGRLFFEARDGGGSVFGFTLPSPDRRM
ncbi:two-component sensor histidine kinase [Luteimonas sp. BDR2-5]|uniref:sensor histidine kinase n=1 Tax=Proluteimonas luteida TaxID=2878685 RepID=UPI001E3B4401|nr:ATP-binding protein [Luteimonas sp. BDR2-5]MCD9029453.1 two-component sensor histidine kinase [Luteimonas sp. BDR2-5]